jgi:hypothetical protein
MAFTASVKNGFVLLSAISPLLLGFFLIMGSIFNNNIKGVLYLGGVLIASLINTLMLNPLFAGVSRAGRSCNLVEWSWASDNREDSPAYSSMFIAFTLAYLTTPMVLTNQINGTVIATISILFFVDAYTRFARQCVGKLSVLLGLLFGTAMGIGWCMLFYVTGHADLLYFNDLISNNVICSRPKKQTFKCSIYKNGELVKNL